MTAQGVRNPWEHTTTAQHGPDRQRAERALGHPLKPSQPIHHHSPTQLVICESQAYHKLLHKRTLEARSRTSMRDIIVRLLADYLKAK